MTKTSPHLPSRRAIFFVHEKTHEYFSDGVGKCIAALATKIHRLSSQKMLNEILVSYYNDDKTIILMIMDVYVVCKPISFHILMLYNVRTTQLTRIKKKHVSLTVVLLEMFIFQSMPMAYFSKLK